jgi:hypothetical protein
LHFTSSQSAVLTINGFSVNVQRYNFWLNETVPDAMLGQWSAVIGAAEDIIFDAERINYNGKYTANTGTVYASGNRLGSSGAANLALVTYFPSQGAWSALVDSSSSYYRLFIFNTTGFNRVEGSFWIYLKTSSPTGNGTFYQAFRTASAARIITGIGPGSSKGVATGEATAQKEKDARLAEALGEGRSAKALLSEGDVLEIAKAMEAMLKSHRANDDLLP